MGYCKQRVNRQGHARYTAYYWDLRGRARSAGTFSRKREARARLPRPWARTRSGPCPPEPVTGRVVEHRVPILQFTAGVLRRGRSRHPPPAPRHPRRRLPKRE